MNISEQKDRPAYVRFELRAVEDRELTVKNGHYSTKDEATVLLTPAGSKDEVVKPVRDWLEQMKHQVREGRLPAEWEAMYVRAYEAWRRGEEIPLNGTPLKGWPIISPAQLQVCLAANVRTVEDLAAVNGEGLHRIGMGAQELKQRAEAWLKASKDIGGVVSLNSALQAKVAHLEGVVKQLEERNGKLVAQLQAAHVGVAA